jgi:hypothetical protein
MPKEMQSTRTEVRSYRLEIRDLFLDVECTVAERGPAAALVVPDDAIRSDNTSGTESK